MMDEEGKKRTPNFTIKEKMSLLNIVEKYKDIIENKGTSCSINNKKTDTWAKITAEFNSETETTRTTKHLRLLYTNLKRKTKKDIAEEHKVNYILAKLTEEEDKRELNKTGGGTYKSKLDNTGAQMLAILQDQIEPLQNEFDDAADYFHNVDTPGTSFELMNECESIAKRQERKSPERKNKQQTPQIHEKKTQRRKKKKILKKLNYKQLYFKKKYETACFELKAKKHLYSLDVKIKQKQLRTE